jgi:hypothetical protein
MASNNNNNNDNDNNNAYGNPTETRDWLSRAKSDMRDRNAPLGLIKGKPLSYFDAITRNYCREPNLFQVNLGQFPQNFLVTTWASTKVRITHGLFIANTNPETNDPGSVVGIFGSNRVAPFKTISATAATLGLIPFKRDNRRKDPETLLPTIQQFANVESAGEFAGIVGEAEGEGTERLADLPNSHLIHPQVFLDVGGKREWEASELALKLISIYEDSDEGETNDDDEIPPKLMGINQLLIFLWGVANKCGIPVPLGEIPEVGEVTALCYRKAATLDTGQQQVRFGGGGGQGQMGADEQAERAETRRLTEAMVVNLNKSSEAYAKQITKDDSSKCYLSRLAPDQASVFRLLTTDTFEVDGIPELNTFTAKLTENRDPIRAINMVRQETRGWGGTISDKSLLQLLSSGFLAPDMNKEPDGLTSLGFFPHHERYRFEDRSHTATDNMRAMFGEKTFDEESIKRYAKKQFFIPSRIEDWSVQLISTARFLDLLTAEEGIAAEAYRTAQDLYEQNEQTFRAAFQADKLMMVKVLHFLDRVFQEFVSDLSRFSEQTDPLRSAAASLRGRQRNTVLTMLGPLKYGVKPTISLPPGLLHAQGMTGGPNQNQSLPGLDMGTEQEGNERGRGGATDVPPPRMKQISNMPARWKLPRGKIFGDFFNPRVEGLEGNLSGWPLATHDRSGVQKPICVRLMVSGKCPKENCIHAHVKPSTLSQSAIDSISTRLAEIYQQQR